MKVPATPPSFTKLLEQVTSKGPDKLLQIVATSGGAAPDGKYRHWDTLRYIKPPEGLTSEEWWLSIKVARMQLYTELPLIAKDGKPFRYALVDAAHRMLHYITKSASGVMHVDEVVTNPGTRDTYLVKSLIEEAITSSQLEGASTTRAAAKDMLQAGRKPRDRSEQMIYNNYQAMQFVRSVRDTPLTPEIILELHRILTQGTLDDPSAAGRLRRADEDIVVEDLFGSLLHTPPHASTLAERLEALCAFANDHGEDDRKRFLHPVLRAILLHFALGYDHPFVDGNGRTARGLFYWSLAVQGYWLSEFISISRILKKAPARYSQAYLYVETDDNDVTYFLLNQLRVTERAIRALHRYLAVKAQEIHETEQLLRHSALVSATFNYRQLSLCNHALKHPGFSYTFESHRRSHRVAYQTARTDLLALEKHGLLERLVRGRTFVFAAPIDLRRRLEGFGRAGGLRHRSGGDPSRNLER
ncbi:MAG: Fic family protein [Gemmatimonadetes bacterium]|nr:Fic family protein [Gemmatimonadota bacterium]